MNKKIVLVIILIIASFLRLWKISEVPVSLFGDELDVGYHAYSILKTGKDYSGNPWPLHFQSLAEWRTPLYLYSAVPTVAIFGISPLGVRLPAAIFGILGVWLFYLLVGELIKLAGDRGGRDPDTRASASWRRALAGGKPLAGPALPLIAAALLAISPWHIQYSRAGFEVTQMLAFFLAGLWLFLKGLKSGKWLPLSAICFALAPWVYSTAKFFVPLTLLALLVIWRKELFGIGKKWLVWSAIALVVIGGPIAASTIFGGGTERFSYLSVFTDPTTIPEVGFARLRDAMIRTPGVEFGVQPEIIDRAAHNKVLFWTNVLGRNYLQSFSTHFLFLEGDLNLRHSLQNFGQFYRFEILFLLAGMIFFFKSQLDRKIKFFLIFWLLAAPIPAALTRDGGMHATRLFFFLPPLILLNTLGIFQIIELVKKRYVKVAVASIAGLYLFGFASYQHNYWVHYPWDSERWWHAGFGEAINGVKEVEGNYDRIIISTADEPPWIFFAGWYEYPPQKWHENYPFKKKEIRGFGEISYIDKFYFGTAQPKSGIYSLAEFLDEKTLYLASAKEFNINFIQEPERLPKNLTLVKAIPYPSGEPVFYLFTLNPQNNK